MIGATTDNIANLTMPFNKEFLDLINTHEHSNTQSAVISIIIILNVIMNSLVIAVIARYPQLREDRATLFMFSLSVSDLAAGCTFMPISAALCSKATTGIADIVGLLREIYAFMMWSFGFNSMYSLCWLILPKAIVILNPFKVERFFYSQMLLLHHWHELDYWLHTCCVKLHRERKMEYCDVCIRHTERSLC